MLVVLGIVLALTLAEIVLRAVARRTLATRTHRYLTIDPVLHHRARPGFSARDACR